MRIKPLRNVLMATTGISLAMIAGVGGWALLGGSDDVVDLNIPSVDQQNSAGLPTSVVKEPKRFDHLWNVPLQDPRNQQAVVAPQAVAVKPANVGFGIKLVGTMIDPTKTLALFRDELGVFDLKGVGDPLVLTPAGAQIENIESGIATLSYEGRQIRLEIAANATPAPPTPNFSNGAMQAGVENPDVTASEPTDVPMSMMTPASPEDAVPGSEDDLFAPLPAHMNPYASPPSTPMESRL
jgi:hypothetical protein